jgi:hypothetical protein
LGHVGERLKASGIGSENIITNHVETPWPLHADGRPKKIDEMTPDERKALFKDAAQRVNATMEATAMREAIREFVDGVADAQAKH